MPRTSILPGRVGDLGELPRAAGTPLEPDLLMFRDVLVELIWATRELASRIDRLEEEVYEK
jgi:hypothetical protein